MSFSKLFLNSIGGRFLSALQLSSSLHRAAENIENENKEFDDVFPIIVEDFAKYFTLKNLPDVADWFSEVLIYNVPNGKKNRGMAVVSSFKMLVGNPSREQLHIARIVGWCWELLFAALIINDDIMDKSTTRRGQPCWYKQPHVGIMAINDTIMLNSCMNKLLSIYIKDEAYLSRVSKCLEDIIWLQSIGQCLDLLSSKNKSSDLSIYTYESYRAVVQYKTAYSYCLPVRLALVLAGMEHAYTPLVEDLMLDVGRYYQAQDDYLDCYGDPEVTGKIGTDIEEGKSCWPIVVALSRANSEDRKILEENYGVADTKCSQKVRDVYDRIGLKELYALYEEETIKEIYRKIEEVSKANNIPQDIFYSIVNNIHNREK